MYTLQFFINGISLPNYSIISKPGYCAWCDKIEIFLLPQEDPSHCNFITTHTHTHKFNTFASFTLVPSTSLNCSNHFCKFVWCQAHHTNEIKQYGPLGLDFLGINLWISIQLFGWINSLFFYCWVTIHDAIFSSLFNTHNWKILNCV